MGFVQIASTCRQLTHLSLRRSLRPEVGAWQGSFLREEDWRLVDPCSFSTTGNSAAVGEDSGGVLLVTPRTPCVHAVTAIGASSESTA